MSIRGTGAVPDGDASLWRDRNFNLFWCGQTLSTLGDAFTTVAFPLLVLRMAGSVESMTMVTAFGAAGRLLSGVVAGRIVDAAARRRVLITTDLIRAFLMAAIPGLAALGLLSFPLLCAISLCVGALGNLFGVAYTAFVLELVSKKRVTEANAKLQGSAAASFVIGPALAGLAAQRWGPAVAVGVDALSFAASLVSLAMLRGTAGAPVQPKAATRFAGVELISSNPSLRAIMGISCVELALTAPAIDMFTYQAKTALRQSDSRVGVMFAVASIGALAGAVLTPVLKRRLGTHVVYVVTAGAMALVFALAPLARSVVQMSAAALVFTCGATIRGILSMSLRQEVTPGHLLGRVTSTFWLALAACSMVGAAGIGRFASVFGNDAAFWMVGSALLLLTLATVPLRTLGTSPVDARVDPKLDHAARRESP